MDLLSRIKRLVIRRAIKFTLKASMEADRDGLTEDDIIESIMNAGLVRSKRSTSQERHAHVEKIHIIQGFTFDGIFVYTKGVIRKEGQKEVFYVLVSAKRNTLGGQE